MGPGLPGPVSIFIGPIPEKPGPVTSYRLPCARVNTYLAGTDDYQTETGLGKPGSVSENRDHLDYFSKK